MQTLTKGKIQELKDDINGSSPLDVIAVTEIKPKNYTKQSQIVEYKNDGYEFESVKLKDRGSTKGVGTYFRKSLKCSKDICTTQNDINLFKLGGKQRTDSWQYLP